LEHDEFERRAGFRILLDSLLPDSSTAVGSRSAVSEHEELKRRFALESAARKKYYNEVLEMKGEPAAHYVRIVLGLRIYSRHGDVSLKRADR
jgi:hypothetical protein